MLDILESKVLLQNLDSVFSVKNSQNEIIQASDFCFPKAV